MNLDPIIRSSITFIWNNHDVEDNLDNFTTEALERKLINPAHTNKFRTLIPSSCTSFTPSAVRFNVEMRSKVEKITVVRLQNNPLLTENISGKIKGPPKKKKYYQPLVWWMNLVFVAGKQI